MTQDGPVGAADESRDVASQRAQNEEDIHVSTHTDLGRPFERGNDRAWRGGLRASARVVYLAMEEEGGQRGDGGAASGSGGA